MRQAARRAREPELTYERFRTGLTFREVKRMLWSPSDDRSTWRYRRRHTVLGKWHQIKLEMWAHYHRCIDERARRGRRRGGS